MRKILFSFRSFRSKVTIILALLLFIVVALSNFLIYRVSFNSQFYQLREQLRIVAQTIALQIDPDLLLSVPLEKKGVHSEQYRTIAKQLRRIKKVNPQILYIYTMAPTERDGIWQFIVDPDPTSKDRKTEGATSYPGDRYDASYFPELAKAYYGPSADKELTVADWGVTLSGYAPIRDKDGNTVAILGIDISAQNVYGMKRELNQRAIFVLLMCVLISLGLGVLASKNIAEPLKKLEEATRRIAAGDLQYKVQIKGSEEISSLGRSFNKMAESLSESRKALHDYFYRAVQSLVRSLEAKDSYTKGHSERVAEYAQKIALEMGFSQEESEMLNRVAQLHDVGKLGIDEDILNKKEKLTDDEWKMIKRHPITGEEILRPVFLDEKMLAIVRSHHERYDGSGYPDGLKGNKINILAQIVSISDSYDAMISVRAYRDPLSKEAAIEEIKKNSGIQFNPLIVEAFLKVLQRQ